MYLATYAVRPYINHINTHKIIFCISTRGRVFLNFELEQAWVSTTYILLNETGISTKPSFYSTNWTNEQIELLTKQIENIWNITL